MVPIDRHTITTKLLRLEKNLDFLEEYQKISKQDFLKDYTVQGATLHYMVECIEIIIDIGNHLLTNRGESTHTYREVILQLGKYQIIPTAFAKKNADMTNFRNLIIHAYEALDIAKVYQELQKAPNIFRRFVKYYYQQI